MRIPNWRGPPMRVARKYKTKPVEIEAAHLSPESAKYVREWMTECGFEEHEDRHSEAGGLLAIKTLEGVMIANAGDYVIRGLRNEFYPCKPDVFHMKYEISLGTNVAHI